MVTQRVEDKEDLNSLMSSGASHDTRSGHQKAWKTRLDRRGDSFCLWLGRGAWQLESGRGGGPAAGAGRELLVAAVSFSSFSSRTRADLVELMSHLACGA